MKVLSASLLLLSLSTTVVAQSNYKESSNSFARYTQTGDIKQLESAKKFIDAAYKTKRDSSSRKNNILRAMVYSSLAYADSTRKIKTDKDPIEITTTTLSKLKDRDKSLFETEINYINQNLLAAYIYKANKHVEKKEYQQAYESFLEVDKLGSKSEDVVRNLAFLSAMAGKTDEAINYYTSLIKDSDVDVNTYLALANLYKTKKDQNNYIGVLRQTRDKFPEDKRSLFLLIEAYADTKSYPAIVSIIDEATKIQSKNIELLYLAGFSNESVGNIDIAKEYYTKALSIDEDYYDANLALGLLYLNQFLNDSSNYEAQYNAQEFLLKANAIKPYAINTLKGLALFYESTENLEQLDRVKTLIESIIE